MTKAGGDAPDPARFKLRLFVAGATTRSQRTIANLHAICVAHLGDTIDLEIVDIYQHPAMVEADQIVAAPTLLKLHPLPVRRIIGDLADTPRVLRALGIAIAAGEGR